jgi:hypothetical protein
LKTSEPLRPLAPSFFQTLSIHSRMTRRLRSPYEDTRWPSNRDDPFSKCRARRFARTWCADTCVPQKAGASSASARTTASRPRRERIGGRHRCLLSSKGGVITSTPETPHAWARPECWVRAEHIGESFDPPM